jgi:hypothetical protein
MKKIIPSILICMLAFIPLTFAQTNQNPDIDGSGEVDILDVLQVVNDFGKTAGFNPRVDLNNDGLINALDIFVIVNNWGKPTSSQCNNGIIESGEECDGSNIGEETCASIDPDGNFAGGILSCSNLCSFDTSGCLESVCGNSVVEAGEQCDGFNLRENSCSSLGYIDGILGCSNCNYNVSLCKTAVCQNGIAEPGEDCDTSDLRGQSCTNLINDESNFIGGTLRCKSSCLLDTSGCNKPTQPPIGHLGGGGHDFGPFDKRKIPVEMQSWWVPDFGHIHALTMLPLGQKVSGMLNFDVRVVLHDNPSEFFELRIDHSNGRLFRHKQNYECKYPNGHQNSGELYNGIDSLTCSFNIPVSINTADFEDGWREFRIRATTKTVDEKRYLNSGGIPIYFENGNSVRNYDRGNNHGLIGRGWYEEFDYTNSWIETVPEDPISGVYTFRVRAQKQSQHLTVALDKTHPIPKTGPWPKVNHDAGKILFSKDGNFQKFFDINIDTRELANGWHSLAVNSESSKSGTSDCSYCEGEQNRPHGIAKAWFYVKN